MATHFLDTPHTLFIQFLCIQIHLSFIDFLQVSFDHHHHHYHHHIPILIMSSILLQLVTTFVYLLLIPLTCSTSRPLMNDTTHHDHHHQIPSKGFKITLKHVDSNGNFSKFELLQRGIKRGNQRLHRLSSALASPNDKDVHSPVHAGSGEFLMNLAIGTPPTAYSAILDTGSDLIWTQCKPCSDCFKQPTPIFDPQKSSTFSKVSCSSELCSALPISMCDDSCQYVYSYGDYSSTQGLLATETFVFDQVSVPKLGFGCGNENQGGGFSQGAGIVGLGRGPLSLVSQIGSSKFSYCLTSIYDSQASSLLVGTLANINNNNSSSNENSIKTTPLLKNPAQPSFYYLSLEGITVGDTLLDVPKSAFALKSDGTGGLIIDSGTTITYLENSAFKLVKKAFKSQMKLSLADDQSDSTGLDLCFNMPSNVSNEIDVPKLIFHFKGADLDLPGNNYMIADSSVGLICLAMGGSSGMSILGNVQQQNMLVLHDLEKETLSFMSAQCDQV